MRRFETVNHEIAYSTVAVHEWKTVRKCVDAFESCVLAIDYDELDKICQVQSKKTKCVFE